MIRIATLPLVGIAPDVLSQCASLHWQVWPKDTSLADRRATWIQRAIDADPGHLLHVAFDGAVVVAMALTFPRAIAVDDSPQTILALAAVCSDPRRRGEGFGHAVVTEAFARLQTGPSLSLFQTGSPDFYRRFGSRPISNRIINSRPGRAFWEPHAMIHPGTAGWPDGTVDLLGPGW